ncbi:MAG: peptidase S45 [Gammaproteobacteria bacterium]|nr:MAG: peptidase S45 [Gammaproteobacteria bacterium]
MVEKACIPVVAAALLSLLVPGCDGNDDDTGSSGAMPLAAADGSLEARIRYTTAGVPHIEAADLASLAFGVGYAQARDNVCLIAESIVKVRGERSLHFGPGVDDANIISDFSYKVVALPDGGNENLSLSAESEAMLDGYAAGYNRYLSATPPAELPPACRDAAWVRAISRNDLLKYHTVVAKYASGDLFTSGAILAAVPPGVSPQPTPNAIDAGFHRLDDTGLASNAWGIGAEMSESGRGALLANPHFPYTGPRRFYQMHLMLDGHFNVNGAGLIGVPLPLIGFNETLAWSHTVSTSRRFTLYELTLAEGNPLAYVKDGRTVPITARTIRVQVANGTDTPTTLEREIYFSEYGPMLAADLVTGGALPSWGENETAYTYRDANERVGKLFDTWLGLGSASNLDEVEAVFENCGSTLWTNTIYADADGNAFYIDSSSVPNLSAEAIDAINAKIGASENYARLFRNGLTLLDGSTSRDDWVEGSCNGHVPYADMPKLTRRDFVQNSNSSYWQTNPAAPLTGFSPLYGDTDNPVNARTQLGLRMLQSPDDAGHAAVAPAGQDGRFGAMELLEVIWANRSLHAELGLAELQQRCALTGGQQITGESGKPRSVEAGCGVLANWDGLYNIDSVGAHVFRVFMAKFLASGSELDVVFDSADPANTAFVFPDEGRGTPSDPVMIALASALDALDAAGIAYDASLGAVQSWTPSGGVPPAGPGGDEVPVLLAERIPWHGGSGDVDGVFNAVRVAGGDVADDTILPRVNSSSLPATAGLSSVSGEGWAITRGTSWHFGLEFTDEGPVAFGLLSYSQSTDPASPHFIDQSLDYASKTPRRLLYREADIAANLLPDGEITITGEP